MSQFPFGAFGPIFRGKLAVSFREATFGFNRNSVLSTLLSGIFHLVPARWTCAPETEGTWDKQNWSETRFRRDFNIHTTRITIKGY